MFAEHADTRVDADKLEKKVKKTRTKHTEWANMHTFVFFLSKWDEKQLQAPLNAATETQTLDLDTDG